MRLVRVLKYVLIGVAGLYLLAAVLYAVPVISGALDDTMEVRFSRPDPSLVADYRNGLTPGQKETFYHLSQGSEILPWILLTAVDVADPGSTKPFVENIERYGLLPDPAVLGSEFARGLLQAARFRPVRMMPAPSGGLAERLQALCRRYRQSRPRSGQAVPARAERGWPRPRLRGS